MGHILEANVIYSGIYRLLTGNSFICVDDPYTPLCLTISLPSWLAYFIGGFVIVFMLTNTVMLGAAVFVYTMRRVLGRFQARIGPNRVGPFGLLQPIADIVKLLLKEDTRPTGADAIVFTLAPIVIMMPTLLVFAVIPFGKGSFLADLNIGILFVVAITGISTLAIFMAGWSSNNRFAMFGAMRAVAQLISYEIPMLLSIVGVIMLSESLSLISIVESQTIPFILLQPLGFLIFFVAASAELNRSPFDLLEAESEIIAGYHTEYSGAKFALFQAAEFGAIIGASAIMATLFLGGWQGPFLPSHLWFVIKVGGFVLLFLWIMATFPRLRVDQVMGFAWKFLFPVSLVNIFITAAEILMWPNPTLAQLWLMAGINMTITVGILWVVSKIGGDRLRVRPSVIPPTPIQFR